MGEAKQEILTITGSGQTMPSNSQLNEVVLASGIRDFPLSDEEIRLLPKETMEVLVELFLQKVA